MAVDVLDPGRLSRLCARLDAAAADQRARAHRVAAALGALHWDSPAGRMGTDRVAAVAARCERSAALLTTAADSLRAHTRRAESLEALAADVGRAVGHGLVHGATRAIGAARSVL